MRNYFLLVLLFLVAESSIGAEYPALRAQLPDCVDVPKSEIAPIKYLPRMRSQDGLPICQGMTAWRLFEQLRCSLPSANCADSDLDKSPSPLSLAGMGISLKRQQLTGDQIIPFDPESGGDPYNVLKRFQSEAAYPESCFPFDQFIAKYGNDTTKMKEVFNRLQNAYQSGRTKLSSTKSSDRTTTEGSFCIECTVGDELSKSLGIAPDKKTLNRAMGEEFFEKFLYDVIFAKCKGGVDPEDSPFTLHGWPEKAQVDSRVALDKIKSILADGRPVAVGACLDDKNQIYTGRCRTEHSFVISGFKKCTSKAGTIVELLKVDNSWGQDWQDRHADGWMEAANLMDYVSKGDRDIVWLTPKSN